jgi:hypothetical protein
VEKSNSNRRRVAVPSEKNNKRRNPINDIENSENRI